MFNVLAEWSLLRLPLKLHCRDGWIGPANLSSHNEQRGHSIAQLVGHWTPPPEWNRGLNEFPSSYIYIRNWQTFYSGLYRSSSLVYGLDLTWHTTPKWRQLGISVTVKVCLHLAIVTLLLIVLISSPTRPESIFGLAFNLGRAHQRVQRWLWIAPTIHREERCTAPIPTDRSINDGFPNISAKYQQGLRVI